MRSLAEVDRRRSIRHGETIPLFLDVMRRALDELTAPADRSLARLALRLRVGTCVHLEMRAVRPRRRLAGGGRAGAQP